MCAVQKERKERKGKEPVSLKNALDGAVKMVKFIQFNPPIPVLLLFCGMKREDT